MVLILGLMGSPRSTGNTSAALAMALEGARSEGAETASLDLGDMDISPCTACSHCWSTGVCDIEDDMTRLYELLEKADGMVIATPIYFSGVTAQLKAAIDRCQCLWVRKEVLGVLPRSRRGAFIAVGGSDRPIFRNAVSVVRSYYNTIGASYCDELLVAGVEDPGDVLELEDVLHDAFRLGRDLVRGCRLD